MAKEILVEKYRPTSLDEMIWPDEKIKKQFQNMLDDGLSGHLLLHGGAGVGKSTISKIIANSISDDVLYINASDENNIDMVRTKIKDFCTCMGMSDVKVIILDEGDFLSANAQAALRNIMEEYHKFTRFILTANYPNKIIDPLKSRCQQFKFMSPSKKEIAKLVAKILKNEKVQFSVKQLLPFLTACQGDIRLTINTIQKHIIGDKLTDFTSLEDSIGDLIKHLQNRKFNLFRQEFMNRNVDIIGFYRYVFDNAKDITRNWVDLMLLIGEYSYRHSLSGDPYINLFSCALEIIKLIPGGDDYG